MGTATLNVRMPEELKNEGDKVLLREGVSVSEAVRGLYEFIEQNQELPGFLKSDQDEEQVKLFQAKREAFESMIGIIPPDTDLDAIKAERLARQIRPGVRA